MHPTVMPDLCLPFRDGLYGCCVLHLFCLLLCGARTRSVWHHCMTCCTANNQFAVMTACMPLYGRSVWQFCMAVLYGFCIVQSLLVLLAAQMPLYVTCLQRLLSNCLRTLIPGVHVCAALCLALDVCSLAHLFAWNIVYVFQVSREADV